MFHTSLTLSPLGVNVFGGDKTCNTLTNTLVVFWQPLGFAVTVSVYSVSSSGLATGPHLHFEFRISGIHQNPLTVALPRGTGETINDQKFFAMVKDTEKLIKTNEDIMLAQSQSSEEAQLN